MIDVERMMQAESETVAGQGQGRREQGPLLVNVAGAARMLAVSSRTIWELVKTGQLPTVKIGKRSTRFDVADLARLVERNRQAG